MSDKPSLEWTIAVHKGLGKAILTDIDVMLLAEMGLLLGSKHKRLNGLGKALGAYIAIRKSNEIARLFARVITVQPVQPPTPHNE